MWTPTIVVGTDGTESGTAAVRWAAREAGRRRMPLRVVHILDWDWAVSRYDVGGQHFGMARQRARTVVQDAVRVAVQIAPDVEIAAEVPVGRPVSHLLNWSVSAAELVVGNSGRGGFAGLPLGSVSRRMAARAHCPVVVVRGRAGTGSGPVAAGVDDTDSADVVLEAAFTAAAGRDTGLVAVRSYLPSLAAHLGAVPAVGIETPEQDAVESDRLAERLAPWQAKYPQVPVETLLSHDSAAAMLAEISHGTRLIVVGAHGHGLLSGKLLGSTGVQLLHHSGCPVLVAR